MGALARNALHLRGLALYFAVLVAAVAFSTRAVQPVLFAAAAAAVPLLLGLAYAWAVARTTTYTVTTARVVIRMGIAVPITLNLPYADVQSAGLRQQRDGTGDIALDMADRTRHLSWFLLWPHARPMRLGRPQPLLRGLRDAEPASRLLSQALADSIGEAPANTAAMQVPLAQTPRLVDTEGRHHGTTTVAA